MLNEYERLLASLSENVRRFRAARGMSQEDLALEANVDRTFVSKIERRLANPSLLTVCTLAKALDVSALTLLTQDAVTRRERASFRGDGRPGP